MLGIAAPKQRGVKILRAFGDAELLVKQVRAQYTVKNTRLRNYRNRVWDEIEDFDAFSIQIVPREKNTREDLLATSVSLLLPHPEIEENQYKVEVLFRPNVPDNVEAWQVFNNDKQIQAFMEGSNQFADQYFEGNPSACRKISLDSRKELKLGEEQLKGNKIPHHLISLEKLFERHDAFIRKESDRKGGTSGDFEAMNIGTEFKPKMINIGSCWTKEEREKAKLLLSEYKDVFAWSYDDLKVFRNGDFKHTIPLKPEAVPFRQKQRNYNPKVSDAIFREVHKMLEAKIIYPIHHSTWIATTVPFQKKNGEIRICVDFWNLNLSSLKDNYGLPNMDHILQTVAGS